MFILLVLADYSPKNPDDQISVDSSPPKPIDGPADVIVAQPPPTQPGPSGLSVLVQTDTRPSANPGTPRRVKNRKKVP